MKKKICVVTGSRAEYGLLRPLMDEIRSDKELHLQVIATGSHLSPEFGLTYKEIEKDKFKIDLKIDIDLSSDIPAGISYSMGLAMAGFGKAFEKLIPDMVVVLGDRFEIFSAVSAAHVARIPVAHIHGGEVTEGAIDDAFRHCITKMSHLHFTSTEEYRKRVIQLGESPDRVFNVGAIGLDNINKMKLLSKEQLEKELNLKFKKHNLLVTFHPVTLENNTSEKQFKNLLEALISLKETKIIFTKSNSDTNGKIINKMIDSYVKKHSDTSSCFASMGQLKYLSSMQFVDAVVGNSSSGIIEAPSFKIGTLNIGDRQKGRVKAGSIIDCLPEIDEIRQGLNLMFSTEFKTRLRTVSNPYEGINTSRSIKNKIIKNLIDGTTLKKEFYNIKI